MVLELWDILLAYDKAILRQVSDSIASPGVYRQTSRHTLPAAVWGNCNTMSEQ